MKKRILLPALVLFSIGQGKSQTITSVELKRLDPFRIRLQVRSLLSSICSGPSFLIGDKMPQQHALWSGAAGNGTGARL